MTRRKNVNKGGRPETGVYKIRKRKVGRNSECVIRIPPSIMAQISEEDLFTVRLIGDSIVYTRSGGVGFAPEPVLTNHACITCGSQMFPCLMHPTASRVSAKVMSVFVA